MSQGNDCSRPSSVLFGKEVCTSSKPYRQPVNFNRLSRIIAGSVALNKRTVVGPLKGVRVVEMAGLGAGPITGMMLADWGADVILVDKPGTPSAEARIHVKDIDPLNRNKQRLPLNLKDPAHVSLLREIIALSDVLLESYRPGVMERLGLAPEACMKQHPALVYARLTGWGQTGPMAQQGGHDPNYVAATGALYHTGHPDIPPMTPPTLLGDASAAALLVAGISAALVAVSKTGEGQVIDASIAESTNYLTTYAKSFYQAGQLSDHRGARWLDGAAPRNATYATKDGGFMVVAAIEAKFYRTLIMALGLESDPLFADLDQWADARWPEQKAAVAVRFVSESRAYWTQVFDALDACVSPVLNYEESTEHAHFIAREAYWSSGEQVFPAPAPRFSETPNDTSQRELTDDLDHYLSAMGVTDSALAAWRSG